MRALVTVLLAMVAGGACAAADTALEAVEALARQAAADGLYAGMLHVQQGDKVLLSRGFGQAAPELGVPMRHDHRFPIGSNTKLFTAVAVWQLHAQRKLSVYDLASQHMNSSALGLNGTAWCPRAINASATGPCQTPQLQQLMSMAGGVLECLNCDYAPDAWQQAYCATGERAGPAFTSFAMQQAAQFGAVGLTQFLAASGVLSAPLDFVPGTAYHYSNAGYMLLGHVIEHVSGLPLGDYFRRHIFGPAGLAATLYDPSAGALGLHAGMLPFPAYVAYTLPALPAQFEAESGTSLDQMQAALGSLAGGSGRSGASKAAVLPGGRYAFTGRVPGPSGFDWTAANAAGAAVSTPQDMARWLRVLLSRPAALGLSASLLREMLGLSTQVPGMPVLPGMRGNTTWRFAQGLLVVPAPDHPRGLGVSHVYYLGSLGGFQAALYSGLASKDDADDVTVVSVAATVLPPSKSWSPGIKRAADGRCSYVPPAAQQVGNGSSASGGKRTGAGVTGPSSSTSAPAARDGRTVGGDASWAFGSAAPSASVPGVLCDVLEVVPVKAFSGNVPNLLASRAVEAVTGARWFGLQHGAR